MKIIVLAGGLSPERDVSLSSACLIANSLFDIFEDEMIDAPVVLDRVYDRVRFVNCTGRMEGATVVIDYVEPYGFAGFEVSMAE